MKLFISQPMNGRPDDEILMERRRVELDVGNDLGLYVEVIDSFFQGAPVDAKPLWYLGESLKKLAEADVAFFVNGWQKSRGCKIEHEAAVAYGIEVIYE